MTVDQAREYLRTYPSASAAPCPMTWDEAYELVDYQNGFESEAVRVNGVPLWGS